MIVYYFVFLHLDCNAPDEVLEKISKAVRETKTPDVGEAKGYKEIEASLEKLPILTDQPIDGWAYISSAMAVANDKEYGRNSRFIAYGAINMKPPNSTCLVNYGMSTNEYILSIARLEPENNLEMMFDAYVNSKISIPFFIVGNHLTAYGDFLKDKLGQLKKKHYFVV